MESSKFNEGMYFEVLGSANSFLELKYGNSSFEFHLYEKIKMSRLYNILAILVFFSITIISLVLTVFSHIFLDFIPNFIINGFYIMTGFYVFFKIISYLGIKGQEDIDQRMKSLEPIFSEKYKVSKFPSADENKFTVHFIGLLFITGNRNFEEFDDPFKVEITENQSISCNEYLSGFDSHFIMSEYTLVGIDLKNNLIKNLIPTEYFTPKSYHPKRRKNLTRLNEALYRRFPFIYVKPKKVKNISGTKFPISQEIRKFFIPEGCIGFDEPAISKLLNA